MWAVWRADVRPFHRHSADPRRSGAVLQLHRDPRSVARRSLQEPEGPAGESQCVPIVLPLLPRAHSLNRPFPLTLVQTQASAQLHDFTERSLQKRTKTEEHVGRFVEIYNRLRKQRGERCLCMKGCYAEEVRLSGNLSLILSIVFLLVAWHQQTDVPCMRDSE